jgi:putative protein kinase ArgK-like GTPase of G3E family
MKLRDQARQDVPIVMTTATLGRGIGDLYGAIARSIQKSPQEKERLRARRTHRLIAQTAAGLARRLILECTGDYADNLVRAALSGEITLEEAARRALRRTI